MADTDTEKTEAPLRLSWAIVDDKFVVAQLPDHVALTLRPVGAGMAYALDFGTLTADVPLAPFGADTPRKWVRMARVNELVLRVLFAALAVQGKHAAEAFPGAPAAGLQVLEEQFHPTAARDALPQAADLQEGLDNFGALLAQWRGDQRDGTP